MKAIPFLRQLPAALLASLTLAGAGLLLVAVLLAAGPARAAISTGDPFPALAQARPGHDVVLVDFWASWCAPCRASFPVYAQLYADYHRRGLDVVAVSVDESQASYEAFLARLHPPFSTFRDAGHALVRQVAVPAMPTCLLVGRDGRVRFIHTGFHGPETERELRQEIDALLAESPAKS